MELLTTQQIADILHVSYDTALDYVKNSGVPYIMVGKQYRVMETQLFEFLEAQASISVKSPASNIYNHHNPKPRIKLRRNS